MCPFYKGHTSTKQVVRDSGGDVVGDSPSDNSDVLGDSPSDSSDVVGDSASDSSDMEDSLCIICTTRSSHDGSYFFSLTYAA